MVVGFKVEIYPNTEQEKYLLHCCHMYHDMWNFLVAKFKNNLPKVGKSGVIDYSDKQMQQEFACENIPLRLYRSALNKYAQSVQRVYKKLSNPPKFHKFNPNKQSFCIVDIDYRINNNCINLPRYTPCFTVPKKIELSNLNLPDGIDIVSNVYYTYTKHKWYLSGNYIIDDISIKNDKSFLGIDWGIKNFYTDNNGSKYNYPKSVLREYQRIKTLQSIKDKKIKGSNNHVKVIAKIQTAYERMNNLKSDFIEQVTTELAKTNHIVVEDIDISKFFNKKHKFISRNNMICPKYIFDKTLRWKCKKFGSYFIIVDPSFTSKTCSNCGYVFDNLTLKDRTIHCPCCNVIVDRDVNAAINIMQRGKNFLSQ